MIAIHKKYRTRDGREVRIYATDGWGDYPVHGATLRNGQWEINTWTLDGTDWGNENSYFDLVEVKPRIERTVWLHIFNNGNVVAADDPASVNITHRVACVKVEIDCEEGEGL